MSSFDTLEKSRAASRPIEVYRFAQGSSSYLYTSAEDEITLGSEVFAPTAIARSSIKQGNDSSSRALTITVPRDNPFAAQYVNIVPGQKATVSIIRLQRDESPTFNTQVLSFKGQVMSVRYPQNGHTAEIAVQSIESSGDLNIPRFSYMGQCNHVLYDSNCKVDPSNFDFIGTCSAVGASLPTITVTGAGASGLDFTGGYCKPTGISDYRMIIAQAGDVLTLLLPFGVNVTGLSIQAFAGCDHDIFGDCGLVFDNVLEFGGFAFVPNKNIFATGLD